MVRSTRDANHTPYAPASRRSPFRLANFCRAVAVGATATRLRIAVAGRPMLGGKPLKRAGVPFSVADHAASFGVDFAASRFSAARNTVLVHSPML